MGDFQFQDRKEAGKLIARLLKKYKNENVVVYALPRGGVVTAVEVAKFLHVPLDLIITRKIGHPKQEEYAVAATGESEYVIGSKKEIKGIDRGWLNSAIEKQKLEIVRRKLKYLEGRSDSSARGKIAILVDDGIATGLTMRAAIAELKHRKPKKIIIAAPVVPQKTAEILSKESDTLVALEVAPESKFRGAVGAYYNQFPQVQDEEVVKILSEYKA